MAIEKMKMMGIIGKIPQMNRILRLIILNGSMHVINSISRISSSDFVLPPNEKNIEALEDLPYIKPYTLRRDFSREEEVVNNLLGIFNLKPAVIPEYMGQDYEFDDFMKQIFEIYSEIHSLAESINQRKRSIEEKKTYINNLRYLEKYKFNVEQLEKMNFLTFKLLKLTKENYLKLKKNYENIPAVVLKIKDEGKNVVVASITPKSLEETVERIFTSLNFVELPLPDSFNGTPATVIKQLEAGINEDMNAIDSMTKSIENYREKYTVEVEKAYARLAMEKKVEEVKTNLATGKHLFFMFGFVPESCVVRLKEELEATFGNDIIIIVEDVQKRTPGITPPTKLRNLPIIRPFEEMVKMYGVPAYNEKDPTLFFALSYLLLFGAMFGDVGQGLVLLIAGLLLRYLKARTALGGILSSIGLSSTVFGLLYGSVFGSEEIIPALLVRPMANINLMLAGAVVLGAILIILGFIYSIMNSYIERNLEEGMFGRNGVTGLAFYVLLLYAAYRYAVGIGGLSPYLSLSLVALIILMVFKQPLAGKITGAEKLYRQLPGDYYVEEGFGALETLLSAMSNTISFIRVGAFALNHAGLYIAFATMAEMTNSGIGSFFLLVLGNAVIIGLEGLIVFIQALRLEYYELFSKYFKGDGVEYEPVKIKKAISRKIAFRQKRFAKRSIGMNYAI
ncbi:V-type ATP synthase subunit I [Thermosediminibacter oceani]|uniref:V-type ATPase 116 kDa subunit n=1 Tax=Thermosediminibacter oceani (strain ATCC BAA-1034 / DSM 16646 / JW/IW-1228P) TaxID=555079 RepID=D9RYN1_THEOJ|nr:V-type ATPase 116kDa subunit family protein [Thermosediminibacter oceani]ADL08455.1 V-type ATPase 116 kDa subunit [Thermosediminibacter oceani DSM 16646]